ncbi:MAG: tRNA (adenosine(37)-N6)-threonylcarbamoyltransferase complex ATPase subunit type 1 TsaE [Desulfococcaceae bacterium]
MKGPAERIANTASPEQTRALGEAVARALPDGALVALFGDLGAGKTVFVQGMARAAGVPPEIPVVSPTYTLIHEYPGQRTLIHVDLYRLAGGADLEEIGLYELMDGDALVAVEWAERLDPADLGAHLSVRLKMTEDPVREIALGAVGGGAGEWMDRIASALKELAWL